MEAVPRLPMLQFPIKTADEAILFSQILKQGIRTYYQEDPESYNVEIHELETLRRSVMNVPIDFAGCSLLKKYYCQLHSLCSRFPIERVENLTFQWSFDHDDIDKITQSGGITFEMNCVMYNIAAMHMVLGESEMRTSSSQGMKIACTHFQCAAWAFETLSESNLDSFEIMPIGMTYLKNLALSQAQECILEKSMTDNRKPNIIAKVSMQVVEYLKVSQDHLQVVKKQPKSSNLPKLWEAHIKFKLVYYEAMTLFHLGMQSEEQQKVGEKIAYFEAAAEKLTESVKCVKPLEKSSAIWKAKINDSLTFANDVIQGKLTAAKKENEFVYHEKVPTIATLPDIKGASLVKCIPFNFTDPEVAGQDIFQRLVPIAAHNASSIYSEEKAKLLRQVASQIEERNVELKCYLNSMQLDSFTFPNDESINVLPQELVECCADLNSREAYKELSEAMSLISNAQHEIDKKLSQIEAILREEEEQAKEFGLICGTKQAPSQILNELKREVKRSKEAHKAAQDMNKTLHSAITAHKDNIAKLSSPLDDLIASLPSAVVIESEGEVEARQDIQRLMKKVGHMKAQRADLDAQLRKGLLEDDITRELVVNQGDTEQLFKEKLQKHSTIVSIIEQNLSAQLNIMNALSEANANYAGTRRSINQVRSQRSEIIYSLIASYQAFMNIVQKVENAKEFYSKMEIQLNKAFTRAKSLCKVEEEQRQEKLSVRVKMFSGGASNNNSNIKESSVSGPKLKDYLMAGNESIHSVPSIGTYAHGNSAARPSPVGSELGENRTNMVPGTINGQLTHLSGSRPHQLPNPQSSQYQSLTYQSVPQSLPQSIIPAPQSIPTASQSMVPAPQSVPSSAQSPYPSPVAKTTQYNPSVPCIPQQGPHPQSIHYQNLPIQPIYQPQGGQIPQNSSMPQVMPYHTPTSQYPTAGIQSISSQTQQVFNSSSVPQSTYNEGNRVSSNQIPISVPNYSTSASLSNPSHHPRTIQNYQAPQPGPYSVIGAGTVPHHASGASISHPNHSSQTPLYNNHHYSGQQTTLSSYPTQTTITGASLPYYGIRTPGQNVVSSPHAISNPGISYPNVRPSVSNLVTQNTQMPAYPVQPTVANAASANQFKVENSVLSYRGPSSQHYEMPYSSGGATSISKPQGYLSVVPAANGQLGTNCGTIQTGINTVTVSAGHYSNQPYIQGGFNNYHNWSPSNSVALNPIAASPVPLSNTLTNNPPSANPGSIQCTQPTKQSANEILSNLDLLAGIDITQTMKPLASQDSSNAGDIFSNLPDAVQQTVQDINKLKISSVEKISQQTDESILAKLTQQQKRSTSTVDPLSVPSVLNNLASETERFSKFVLGLNKKSLNGPTNLELKWKELINILDQKCASSKISVSRCYPMKNRFADLLPFDETRVILPSSRDDYINASHVQLNLIENSIPFIVTQAPMSNTLIDFWSMVWNNHVETIVCLNSTAEVKGQLYYPTEVAGESNFGCFSIVSKQIFEASNSCWIRRTLHVTNQETKVTKVVLHCQFLTWPPGAMPESPSQFLQFVEEIRDLQKQQRNKMRSTVVHCVSGTGRSAIFVIMSAYIQHLNQSGCLLDVWPLIVELCEKRRSALHDGSYLLFLYSSCLYYAQDLLMKRGILTDKATFDDNPREKTHVRHPSADLLSSDLSKIKANLGLGLTPSTSTGEIVDNAETPNLTDDSPDSEREVKIGEATLPPNLVESVDPQRLTIDAPKKTQKMTKDQFTNPSSVEEDFDHPFRELDPLWSRKHY